MLFFVIIDDYFCSIHVCSVSCLRTSTISQSRRMLEIYLIFTNVFIFCISQFCNVFWGVCELYVEWFFWLISMTLLSFARCWLVSGFAAHRLSKHYKNLIHSSFGFGQSTHLNFLYNYYSKINLSLKPTVFFDLYKIQYSNR